LRPRYILAALAAGIVAFAFHAAPRRGSPRASWLDPQAPLWPTPEFHLGHWGDTKPQDPAKEKALDAFETSTKGMKWDQKYTPGQCAQLRAFLLDEDRSVRHRAWFHLISGIHGEFLEVMEESARRFGDNLEEDWVYVRTAITCWPAKKKREVFWKMPADSKSFLYWHLRWEFARFGTLKDADRLQAQLPKGANWRADPVIGRIRLHHSPQPDKLAWEILQNSGATPANWRVDLRLMHAYWCELVRYLAFGSDPKYLSYFKEGAGPNPGEIQEICCTAYKRISGAAIQWPP